MMKIFTRPIQLTSILMKGVEAGIKIQGIVKKKSHSHKCKFNCLERHQVSKPVSQIVIYNKITNNQITFHVGRLNSILALMDLQGNPIRIIQSLIQYQNHKRKVPQRLRWECTSSYKTVIQNTKKLNQWKIIKH